MNNVTARTNADRAIATAQTKLKEIEAEYSAIYREKLRKEQVRRNWWSVKIEELFLGLFPTRIWFLSDIDAEWKAAPFDPFDWRGSNPWHDRRYHKSWERMELEEIIRVAQASMDGWITVNDVAAKALGYEV